MSPPRTRHARCRFSIADLLKYVTVCAVLMALAPVTGVPSAVLLAAFALCLISGQGLLAVFLVIGSLLASHFSPLGVAQALPAVLVVAFLVMLGYRLSRAWREQATNSYD